jgi:DNA-binding beta-propeller fold protein YncE
MRAKPLLGLIGLSVGLVGILSLLQTITAQPAKKERELPALKVPHLLPGIQHNGMVQLPNQWRLRPAGTQLEVGDFPVNQALHPSGQFMAILHAGFRDHEITIVELGRRRTVTRKIIDQAFYGLSFSPDGKKLYASGGETEVVHEFDFDRGTLSNPKTISLKDTAKNLIVGGVTAISNDELIAVATWGDTLYRIPTANPENRTILSLSKELIKAAPKKVGNEGNPPSPEDGRKKPKDKKADEVDDDDPSKGDACFPYAILPDAKGERAFISYWGQGKVAVLDLAKNEIIAHWKTELHPTEMILSPDGKRLFVACANSTSVSVLDSTNGELIETIHATLYPVPLVGNTPNSLTLTPDGKLLFVANADNNNLAVFDVSEAKSSKSLGFIPVGWYPTSVRFNPKDKKIYVANGKGIVPKANRSGPNPFMSANNLPEYIGGIFKGTMSTIDLPTKEQMAEYTAMAYACSPMRAGAAANADDVEADNPIPKKVGDPSPIKHCIYIIKENRTYDQVFGDLPKGNGDPNLCLFPRPITPNHHKLVEQFVTLDNIYVDGEVSADGHEWTMGAYATDFTEKAWPLSYRGGKKIGYPSEGGYNKIERGAGGYLWDRAKEAGVSYRTYGEWITNVGKVAADGTFPPSKATVPELEGLFDPQFRGYDLSYPDVKRAERFISELKRFEKEGAMPRLQVVRIPNDHTSGTGRGAPTPTAQVADNDLALGMVIEGLSQTKFWKDTAVFVIEDDAQNGPDHVDAHRVVALVISPYTKRGHVDSTMYSTTSMLRTMELILGMKPMSQYDAAARPMYHSFTAKPDFSGYTKEIPQTDLNAKNVAGAWGQEWSDKANLAKEDAVDDIEFNEVIWRSVKGPRSKMPAPVRGAFFRAIDKDDDDDDD